MKTRYVYYDKETGLINQILSKRKPGRAPYIKCDNSDVEGFITATKSFNKYVVAYNRETDKTILMERNNVVAFRKQSKDLYKIPYKKNFESDITIVHYKDDVLEVSIDMSRISPLFNTNFGEQVCFENGTEIRIIVKEKKTGDLIKEIVIDAQKLLDSAQMFFKLENHDVEFFTYKLFNSYSWFKGTLRYLSPIKSNKTFNIYKADTKIASDSYSYHFVMKPTNYGIQIVNNIEDLKLIKFSERLNFFVVDKYDSSILYEKFSLDRKLLKEKKIEISLETDVKGKTILYNNKYVNVFLEE